MVASVDRNDPNTVAGSSGGFAGARESTGVALAAPRRNLTQRNFDGHIAAVELYELVADSSLARQLATAMARDFTSDAQPE